MFRERFSQTIKRNFSNIKTIDKLVLISFLNVFFLGTLEAQTISEYTADFETDIRPISREQSSYPPLRSSGNSPQIVTAENGITPRSGTHMMKSVVNRFTSAVNYRTEAVAAAFQDFNGEFEKGKDYWLGVSVFIPADWSMDYGATKNGRVLEERLASGIILQFHDRSYLDKSWRYGLPLVVSHTKQGFRISNRADGCGNTRQGQQTRPGCIPGTPIPQFKKENIPMLLGQWNDFVMHIKWSDRSDGFIDIWVNGEKELEQDGVNYYSEHTKYPYFKMGLYQSSYKLKGWSKDIVYKVNERTLYHDELRIGGSESSFEEVAPVGAFIPDSQIGDNPTTNTDPSNDPDVTIDPPQVALTADAWLDKLLRCDDSYRTIGGSGTSNDAEYRWTTNDGHILSDINSKTAKGDKAGTYTLTVSKAGSVTVSDEVVITKESNCAKENDNPVDNSNNSSSLVSHYTFDNISGNTISDHSNQKNNASIHGATITTGKKGDALQFDGISQFVDAGSFDVPGQALTLAAWIKADSFAINDARIISKATGVLEQDHYWMLSTIENNGSKLRFRLKTDDQTTTLIGTKNIPLGEWVHVAAVYDGTTMKLFVDGQESGSVNKTGSISTDPSIGVHIGDNPATGNRNFHGAIDDLRVYSHALSTNELIELGTDSNSDNESEITSDDDSGTINTNDMPSDDSDTLDSQLPGTLLNINGDFETGDLEGFRKSGNEPKVSTIQKKNGGYSGDFTLTRDMRVNYRTEVVLGEKGRFNFDQEYWLNLDYFYEDWDKDNIRSTEIAPFQIHSTPSSWENGCNLGAAVTTAPFLMTTNRGEVFFKTYGGNILWRGPVQKKQWLNIKVHFMISKGSAGFVEAWKDGVRLGRADGANTPELDKCGKPMKEAYFKMGIYKPYWRNNTTDVNRRQLFIDNLRITTEQ